MKMLESSLSFALRSTTLEDARTAGRYDAIVVGAGAAGGMAALFLTEAGLRVLVLDAGMIQSRLRLRSQQLTRALAGRIFGSAALINFDRRRQPVQSQCYAWPLAPKAFVDDIDCPYVSSPEHPFVWLRSRQLGGRIVIPGHGRQYYRLSPNDFAPADGQSLPWPFQARELDQWYEMVERRLGLAGNRDNLPWLPDGDISTLLEPTPAEAAFQTLIKARWPNANPILGRFAAPFDFLEAAAKTGRLLIRTGAVVREIDLDKSGTLRGVIWIDQQTRTTQRASAPLVFLCASALESTRILLLSQSPYSQNGLGATSGALGRYLMDHVAVRALGRGPRLLPSATAVPGRCIYLPRFDARDVPIPGLNRGFGVQINQVQTSNDSSRFSAVSFAEMIPRSENRVTLDTKQRDAWDIPVLNIDCRHSEFELTQARDQVLALREISELAGIALTSIDEAPRPPGFAIHECGTARMGYNSATSVLSPYNECWEAQGLYVTDGACFPSQGAQNPVLTILALTARACNHALE